MVWNQGQETKLYQEGTDCYISLKGRGENVECGKWKVYPRMTRVPVPLFTAYYKICVAAEVHVSKAPCPSEKPATSCRSRTVRRKMSLVSWIICFLTFSLNVSSEGKLLFKVDHCLQTVKGFSHTNGWKEISDISQQICLVTFTFIYFKMADGLGT